MSDGFREARDEPPMVTHDVPHDQWYAPKYRRGVALCGVPIAKGDEAAVGEPADV